MIVIANMVAEMEVGRCAVDLMGVVESRDVIELSRTDTVANSSLTRNSMFDTRLELD